jgi:hypothetical protein
MRITKGMVQAALAELNCIHELATDPQTMHGTYQYHSPSANRHVETLTKAKAALPAWIGRNRKHLESQGWRFPYSATFEAAA